MGVVGINLGVSNPATPPDDVPGWHRGTSRDGCYHEVIRWTGTDGPQVNRRAFLNVADPCGVLTDDISAIGTNSPFERYRAFVSFRGDFCRCGAQASMRAVDPTLTIL